VHTILPEIQNGTVKLLVDLEQPHNPQLRNKMRVDVNIVTERKAGVLVLDNGAAFNGKGRQPAFAVRDGAPARPLLELGASDGKVVEVVAGAQRRRALHRLRHQRLQGPRQHPHHAMNLNKENNMIRLKKSARPTAPTRWKRWP
jgi:hypothetical protein